MNSYDDNDWDSDDDDGPAAGVGVPYAKMEGYIKVKVIRF